MMTQHLRRTRIFPLLLLMFALLLPAFAQKAIKDLKPTVILISLDGFRYDFIDKYHADNLKRMAKDGVRARWMIPSFPTKTFPNHYTIATGLYPEHHGIIENNIYDFGTTFSLGKREEVQNARWWLGEPIWVTAEKQGQRAGAFFFPGTEAAIAGVRPSFWKEYDGKIPNEARVETLLSWLDLPAAQRPTFYTLYFSDVDDAGHEFSPDSIRTRQAVKKVDKDLGLLIRGLKKRDVYKRVNLIVVSDHGMAAVDPRSAVYLDDYFSFDDAERMLWTNEIVQITPKSGKEDAIAARLKAVPHATCWKKADIPARLHYKDSKRIAPIVCSAEEGFMTTSRERYADWLKRNDATHPSGAHGYDNKYQSMQATFIAHGAAFKKGYIAEPFANIHVYNLMCEILGLKPAPNDGDLSVIAGMLNNRRLK